MVTIPSEAADDPILVRRFLNRGMNIMRINWAHDSAAESCVCTNDRTGYVIQGTKLQLFRGKELSGVAALTDR